jgi:hypothetical protein
MFSYHLNKKAFASATVATLLLIALVFIGSRKLQNFDAALIAYLFGTVFATFGIVYRYAVWLQRPPTWLYFKRTWQILFSGRFFPYLWLFFRKSVRNIGFQYFIRPRGARRWWGHFLMASGCMLAFAVTIPLTLGWIHFTMDPASGLNPAGPHLYEAHVFGFEVFEFKLGSIVASLVFNVLSWSSWLVIIGVGLFMYRRFTNGGLIATQSFGGDWLPLVLLVAISVTGLGLAYDYTFLGGTTYEFMAVTHAVTVIIFLVWIPFGKFFHIIQRPAQIGVYLYHAEGRRKGMAVCKHTGKEYTSQQHVDDLKSLTRELGIDFTIDGERSHLDYSPEGKRSVLAQAHLKAREESGRYFG